MIIFIVRLAIIIGILFYIHRRFKTEEEDNSGLKVIGYYILAFVNIGNCSLSFSDYDIRWVIPIGFLIGISGLRPKKNKKMKRAAVVFGFIMLLVGFIQTQVIPGIQKYYFMKEKYVAVSDSSIKEINLKEDYEKIISELELKGIIRIGGFSSTIDGNGDLVNLRYIIKRRTSDGVDIYKVKLSNDKMEYKIKGYREKWDKRYNQMTFSMMDMYEPDYEFFDVIDDEEFFFGFSQIDLDEINLKEGRYYTLECDGKFSSEDRMDFKRLIITADGLVELKEDEQHTGGYEFFLYEQEGNKETKYRGIEFILPRK